MTMDSNTKIAQEESDNLMRTFNIFPNYRKPVNNADVRIKGIKFSPDGQKLVAANNERVIELYDCNTARFENHFQFFKHGISTIDYMDAADKIIVGSNVRGDCTIRELNLSTNQYEASYIGQSQPSHSLSVNLASKMILSGGMDKSMLLFEFRTPNAQVDRHNLSGVPLVAMHPYTDLCAVGVKHKLALFGDKYCTYFLMSQFLLIFEPKITNFKIDKIDLLLTIGLWAFFISIK